MDDSGRGYMAVGLIGLLQFMRFIGFIGFIQQEAIGFFIVLIGLRRAYRVYRVARSEG